MCATGEAARYREQAREAAAARFAQDIAIQAGETFGECRIQLQKLKDRLKNYSAQALLPQLNATMGTGFVQRVSGPVMQAGGSDNWWPTQRFGRERPGKAPVTGCTRCGGCCGPSTCVSIWWG